MKKLRQGSVAVLLLTVFLVAPGCFKETFVDHRVQTDYHPTQVYHQRDLVFGFVPDDPLHVHAECPQGAGKIMEAQKFVDVLIATLTLSLYSPYTVEVYCAKGSIPRGHTAPESPARQPGASKGQEEFIDMGGLKPIRRSGMKKTDSEVDND